MATMKKIRFCPSACFIDSVHEYTDEERHLSFYTFSDYRTFREEAKQMADVLGVLSKRSIKFKSKSTTRITPSSDNDSTRGTEDTWSEKSVQRRRKRRDSGYEAVFTEILKQREESLDVREEYDVAGIALMYSRATKEAIKFAYKVGLEDAIEAKAARMKSSTKEHTISVMTQPSYLTKKFTGSFRKQLSFSSLRNTSVSPT